MTYLLVIVKFLAIFDACESHKTAHILQKIEIAVARSFDGL